TDNTDIDAMIATLEAKIEALTTALTALRAFQGVSSDGPGLPGGGGPRGGIHSGTFYGKTIPEATRQYLGMCNKRPQAIEAIAAALQKGGIETKAANFPTMVQTILRRVDNQTGDIMRMPDGNWALPEWYGKRPTPKANRKGKEAGDESAETDPKPAETT